jgi:hypothetical protein
MGVRCGRARGGGGGTTRKRTPAAGAKPPGPGGVVGKNNKAREVHWGVDVLL